mgnify:CR=1 FL=1
MDYQLSKQEIIQEIVKCGKNPAYFINNFARITHPLHGPVPFKLYKFQEDCIKQFVDYRFNIVVKARQLGLSTTAAAYVSWLMLFHRDKSILVVATKLSTAANLVKKVKSIIKNLPEWLTISKITTDNKNSFELDNGSWVKASSTSGDAGRSEALSLLVVDEAAHIENIGEMWAGLYPTLSTGGRCIALSTPFGIGNWFYDTYTKAEAQENDFNPIILPWNVHPDRDTEWFKKETRNMPPKQIAQELECNFNMSGDTLLSTEDILFVESLIKEPKYKSSFDHNLWIWETYDSQNKYFMVADVARGDGADYSVFHIFRNDTMEQVAEYQGKVPVDVYAKLIYDVSKEYGFCLTAVENNTVGFAVLEKLKEMRHPNLYYSMKSSHEYVDQYKAENATNAIAGFSTTVNTRPLAVAKLEEYIRNKVLICYSSRIYEEFKSFIWNHGKAQASKGKNDDLVMAAAIGCYIRDNALTADKLNVEYRKAILGSIKKSSNSFTTQIPGMINIAKVDQFGNNIISKEYYLSNKNKNVMPIMIFKG